ncbi:MAG: caspase family protein [Vicinamibacteria bacterium]|nr:caspase family protein [Vicinamibacteria bacterium]
MKSLRVVSILGLGLLAQTVAAAPQAPETAGRIRRLALVVGANRGGQDRAPLRYAVADAERFAGLLTRMGGVLPADSLVLREPTRAAFIDALTGTRTRAAAAKAQAARTEVVVYFSGHADERGLMLGREVMTYPELRQAISAIGADIGIAILDACASGAITRLKGGRPAPAFLTDDSVQVQGYAFLTSSSENEAAQEAEHLQGSFFTNALLTGMRGAADASGDGKVTLGEAYQFAFAETLVQTAATQAGAQHPAYDIKMAGSGDVVMTDVRQNSASLILGPEYDGRFIVMDGHRRLIAELVKPRGRRVELGLEPGQYQVYYEQEKALLTGSLRLGEGQRQELVREGLMPANRRPTTRRGGDEPAKQATDNLDGRWRLVFQGGVTNTSVSTTATTTRVGGASGGMQFSTWVRPDLALDLRIHSIDAGVVTTTHSTTTGTDVGYLVGARYYPILRGALRPHVGGSMGAFNQTGTMTSTTTTFTGLGGTRFGGTVEGGLDCRLGGHFLLNLDGIMTLRENRSSRFDIALGFGFIFGSGR